MTKRNILLILIFCLFFALSANNPADVHALTVSPVRMEISGDPSQTLTKNIKLINEQEDARTFYVSFENFTALGETGKPEFLGDDDDLASWISAPSQVTIEPGEAQTIPIEINIPANADPGGHFAAIFWGTNPPTNDDSQIAIGGRLGILILLEVSGDINEAGSIAEFALNDSSTFKTSLPLDLFYRFQNTGNVRLKPNGQVTFKNMLGNDVDQIMANELQGNVLPNTTRRFELQWGSDTEESTGAAQSFLSAVSNQWSDFKLGRYTATLALDYGSGLTDQATLSFFIIPWQLLTVVLIFLILLAIAGKKYNQWIISKAQKKNDPTMSSEDDSNGTSEDGTNEDNTVN